MRTEGGNWQAAPRWTAGRAGRSSLAAAYWIDGSCRAAPLRVGRTGAADQDLPVAQANSLLSRGQPLSSGTVAMKNATFDGTSVLQMPRQRKAADIGSIDPYDAPIGETPGRFSCPDAVRRSASIWPGTLTVGVRLALPWPRSVGLGDPHSVNGQSLVPGRCVVPCLRNIRSPRCATLARCWSVSAVILGRSLSGVPWRRGCAMKWSTGPAAYPPSETEERRLQPVVDRSASAPG